MPRIDAEELAEPEQIYLASSIRAARKVEAMLDARGIDYVIQVEDLGRSTLFGTRRHAAGFYVTAAEAAQCRSLLADGGVAYGIVDEGRARQD